MTHVTSLILVSADYPTYWGFYLSEGLPNGGCMLSFLAGAGGI